MTICRVSLIAAMVMAARVSWGATGTLTVFDDADQNGFDHNASTYAIGMSLQQSVVHSGTTAAVVSMQNFNAASWQAPTTYSTASDYDGISFWLFDGLSSGTQDLALLLYNTDNVIVGKIDLAVAYGAPLPYATWINVRIPLNNLPNPQNVPDPTLFNNIVIRTYSGSGNNYFFIDDVALIGADIFKNGFE
ncbi:MAG: hypothetical protein ABIW82_18425 [Dokdonella sp.]